MTIIMWEALGDGLRCSCQKSWCSDRLYFDASKISLNTSSSVASTKIFKHSAIKKRTTKPMARITDLITRVRESAAFVSKVASDVHVNAEGNFAFSGFS